MTRNSNSSSRRIASAALAIVFTLAVHGAWLKGMDHDAAAVATPRAA